MRNLSLVLFALVTSACADRPYDFHVHNAEPFEQQALDSAVKKWNAKGFRLSFSDTADNDIYFIDTKIPGEKPTTAGLTHTTEYDHGLGLVDVTSVITFSRDFDHYEEMLNRLAMHELGHHLALRDDHLDPGHTMAPYRKDMAEQLTDADLDYVEGN